MEIERQMRWGGAERRTRSEAAEMTLCGLEILRYKWHGDAAVGPFSALGRRKRLCCVAGALIYTINAATASRLCRRAYTVKGGDTGGRGGIVAGILSRRRRDQRSGARASVAAAAASESTRRNGKSWEGVVCLRP
jgi:hypothetical protein